MYNGSKIPLYALAATVVFIAAAVLLILFSPPDNENTGLFIALIVTTVPSLVAAFASERASRDIRNGLVEHKAKEGAKQALQETGVAEVVELTNRGQSSVLAMQALARLLETNTAATQTNTDVIQSVVKDTGTNGR